MRKRYLVLLLIPLVLILSGCGKKKHFAPPLEPDVPFDLTAIVMSCEKIDLKWKYVVQDNESFYIYRKTTSSYSKIAVLDSETTSYNDSFLTPETTYWYRVTAYGKGGESSPSNEVSATTPPEVKMLGYSMDQYFSEYTQKWSTTIRGNVKNNTSQILTVWVRGEFFDYDGVVINAESVYLNNMEPGKSQSFYMYYSGQKIKRVEAWVENYY